MTIPPHVASEARNDINRRFNITWADVIRLLDERNLEDSSGQVVLRTLYDVAEELMRREAKQ